MTDSEEEKEESYDDYLVKARRKLEKDPYEPGNTHGGAHPEFIVHIINNLLFNKQYRKINITVEKEFDNYHLKFTVNERE
jgi:hypothetical protein